MVEEVPAEKARRGIRMPDQPLAFVHKRTDEELSAVPPSDEGFKAFKVAFHNLSNGEEWLKVSDLQPLLAKLGFALSSKGVADIVKQSSPYGVHTHQLHWSEVAWAYSQILRGDGHLDGPAPLGGLSLLPEEAKQLLEKRGVPAEEAEALINKEAVLGEIRPDVLLKAYAPRDASGPQFSEREKLKAEIAGIHAQLRAEERMHDRVMVQHAAEKDALLVSLEAERLRFQDVERQKAKDAKALFFKKARERNEQLCQEARSQAIQRHQDALAINAHQRKLEEQRLAEQKVEYDAEMHRRKLFPGKEIASMYLA